MAGRNSDDEETEGKLEELDSERCCTCRMAEVHITLPRGNYYTATSYDVDENEENLLHRLVIRFCNTHLKKILWPNTMWEVGDAALNRCYELESFTLEVKRMKSRAVHLNIALPSQILSSPQNSLYRRASAFANSGLTEIYTKRN